MKLQEFGFGSSQGSAVSIPAHSKSGTADEKVNATAEALDMSLQYSFVTPLTSMVVTKPESEDGPLIADKLTEGKDRRVIKVALTHMAAE